MLIDFPPWKSALIVMAQDHYEADRGKSVEQAFKDNQCAIEGIAKKLVERGRTVDHQPYGRGRRRLNGSMPYPVLRGYLLWCP
jgi:hypothetical protein